MRSNCSRTAARSPSVSGNPVEAGDACARQFSRPVFFSNNRSPVESISQRSDRVSHSLH